MSNSLLLQRSILQVFPRLAYVLKARHESKNHKAGNDVHNSFKKRDNLEEPDRKIRQH